MPQRDQIINNARVAIPGVPYADFLLRVGVFLERMTAAMLWRAVVEYCQFFELREAFRLVLAMGATSSI